MLFGEYHGSFSKTFADLFKEATALRAVLLSEASYNLEDILGNFSKLVHLRYLRIKSSLDHREFYLPSAMFRLYHLEVIDLQSAYTCVSSTRNMNNLVKLHHFLVPKYELHLHSDIYGAGKLKFIQELRRFRVRKESDGFEPSQLGPLTEIGGSLGIYNLENVQTKESVLGSLVPHSNLQELCVRGHGGTSCPAWLCENLSVKCLESLCLDGVSWKNLPSLGEMWMVNELGEEYRGSSILPPSFHNLKRLELSNISRLKKWVGNGACPLFSCLEVLTIRCCSELIELPFSHSTWCEAQWEEKMAWFPRLEELVIAECPKLESLPPIPWRTHGPCSADLEQVGTVECLQYPASGPKLRLNIEGKGGHGNVFWNALNFSSLTSLEELNVSLRKGELCMETCPPLPLGRLQLLTSLKKIHLYGSSSILSPIEGGGHGMYRFPVEDLLITNCDTSGKELTVLLSFLPNLSSLQMRLCDNITWLCVAETVWGETRVGEEEIMTAEGLLLLPPQLQELFVENCPKASLIPNPLHDDHTEAAAGGGALQRLHSLSVFDCPEFLSSYSSSSSPFFPFPASLQCLLLPHLSAEYIKTLQAFSYLTSLTELALNILGDSRDEGVLWPLLAHGRLTKLFLHAESDLFASSHPSRPHDKDIFSRSSKLFDLSTNNKTGFLAAPICSLLPSTLTTFNLRFDNEIERLTKDQEEALQLLTSLEVLGFAWGDKLQRLPEGLHKLINLRELSIIWCPAIQSLPSLPSSLQELEITRCYAIKSLPNTLPISLEKLKITDCNAIKSLPKNGLPSSMLELNVHDGNSKELKRECRKLIGIIPIVRTQN